MTWVPAEKGKVFSVDFSVYILLNSTGVEFGRYLLRLEQRNALDNPRRRFGWHGYVMLTTMLQDLWLNLSLFLLPLAPFVHKVHRLLTVFAFSVFIASTTYVRLPLPFTPNVRIKVFIGKEG